MRTPTYRQLSKRIELLRSVAARIGGTPDFLDCVALAESHLQFSRIDIRRSRLYRSCCLGECNRAAAMAALEGLDD